MHVAWSCLYCTELTSFMDSAVQTYHTLALYTLCTVGSHSVCPRLLSYVISFKNTHIALSWTHTLSFFLILIVVKWKCKVLHVRIVDGPLYIKNKNNVTLLNCSYITHLYLLDSNTFKLEGTLYLSSLEAIWMTLNMPISVPWNLLWCWEYAYCTHPRTSQNVTTAC